MCAGMKIQKTAMLMAEMSKAVPHFSFRIVFCVSDITLMEVSGIFSRSGSRGLAGMGSGLQKRQQLTGNSIYNNLHQKLDLKHPREENKKENRNTRIKKSAVVDPV